MKLKLLLPIKMRTALYKSEFRLKFDGNTK